MGSSPQFQRKNIGSTGQSVVSSSQVQQSAQLKSVSPILSRLQQQQQQSQQLSQDKRSGLPLSKSLSDLFGYSAEIPSRSSSLSGEDHRNDINEQVPVPNSRVRAKKTFNSEYSDASNDPDPEFNATLSRMSFYQIDDATITRMRKKVSNALETNKMEMEHFEKNAMICASLLKICFDIGGQLARRLDKIAAFVSSADAKVADFESECVLSVKSLLQRIIEILAYIRVYSTDATIMPVATENKGPIDSYYNILIHVNSLVSHIINIRTEYVEIKISKQEQLLLTFWSRVKDHVNRDLEKLLTDLRKLVAQQLCTRHSLSARRQNVLPSHSALTRKLKVIKVLHDLKKFLLYRTDLSDIIVEGFLFKRSKDEKTWKRYFFTLDHEKLCYFEKQDSKSSKRVMFANTFSKVTNVSLDVKKNFCFQIETGDNSVTLCASSETEFNLWIESIQRIITEFRDLNIESNQREKDITWKHLKETELRSILKSLDREEKLQIEIARIRHLNEMQDLMEEAFKLKLDNSSVPTLVNSVNMNEKIIRSRQLESRKQRIYSNLNDAFELARVVTEDPAGYLAVITGLGVSDFFLLK